MTGTLHAKHQTPSGAAANGEIVVEVNTDKQVIRDPVGNVVFQGPLVYTLVAGEATITLPASDDGTLSPTGFTYTVVEKLSHVDVDNYRTVEVEIPDGVTVHLADVADDAEVAADPSYGGSLNGALALIAALQELHRSGTGSPEGVVTAPVGTLYSRTNGGAGTSLYVKESGAGNTGWVAK